MNFKKFLALALALPIIGGSGLVANNAEAQAIVNSDVPGSFLIFSKFDIRGDQNTQLRIVNNGNASGKVKLNYVCPGVKHVNDFCAALDRTVTFTPHQTRIINVADQNPPCEQGFAVAFAINANNQPVSYNYLTGSYHLFDGRRHEADNALQVQSPTPVGTVLGVQGQLRFNGSDYNAIGRNLVTDFRAVTTEPEAGSRLTLVDLNILAGMQNPPSNMFIDFWNAAEEPFSTSYEFICWGDTRLDDIQANFLETNLGTTYGSMLIQPYATCPIAGTCPPIQPHLPAVVGSISEYGDGTRGLRALSSDGTPNTAGVYQPR